MSVVFEDQVPWEEGPQHDGRFSSRIRRLGRAAGAGKLGCSLYEVAPGQRAFPFHWHASTEEAIYVLSGTGTLRLGEEEHHVGPGAYLALPVGPAHAHQLINTGTEPLRYLCMSAKPGETEVVGYPDSKKVGISVTTPQGEMLVRRLYRADGETRDYFEGE